MLQTFASPSAYQIIFLFQVPKGMLQTLAIAWMCYTPRSVFQVPKGMLQTIDDATGWDAGVVSFQVPKGMLQTSSSHPNPLPTRSVSSPQGNATNGESFSPLCLYLENVSSPQGNATNNRDHVSFFSDEKNSFKSPRECYKHRDNHKESRHPD